MRKGPEVKRRLLQVQQRLRLGIYIQRPTLIAAHRYCRSPQRTLPKAELSAVDFLLLYFPRFGIDRVISPHSHGMRMRLNVGGTWE